MRSKLRLYKRGQVYFAAFYLEGRRVIRSTRCRDYKAAELQARKWEQFGADPAFATAHEATMTDALELLIKQREEEAKAGQKSADTVEFYRKKAGAVLRVFEYPDAATCPAGTEPRRVPFYLRDLKAADVSAFISKRREEGVSQSTIYKELVTVRSALKLAIHQGLWTGDIARDRKSVV